MCLSERTYLKDSLKYALYTFFQKRKEKKKMGKKKLCGTKSQENRNETKIMPVSVFHCSQVFKDRNGMGGGRGGGRTKNLAQTFMGGRGKGNWVFVDVSFFVSTIA